MSVDRIEVLQRAALLFDEWMDEPAAQRWSRIEALSIDEPALAAALRRLFAAHERVAQHTGSAVVAAVGVELQAFASERETLSVGAAIGPFQIVRLLGEGGMGQVYLGAREIDGREQQVAIKLPNRRAAPAAMARFRQERAMLASLSHPAIARLVDVGDSAERPYLAMEFVEGEAIDAYADRQRLTLADRVMLVRKVLGGLQYAHERLVVHRDIKAANVLVDVSGQPRILDFGIGKALDDQGPSTADGQRYFSLACAAPEQIRGEPSSAATDVYSSAVLLYQLLCGAAPLEFAELSVPAALDRAMHSVPPLASQRLAALAPASQLQIALARQSTPAQIKRRLEGDLDAVLARALRKEPAHRYATAQAFADDLAAVLESRPIDARRGERGYRMGRFLRRHRLAASLSAAIAVVIVVSMSVLWLQADNLRRARDMAEQRRSESERVVEFLRGLFRQADPTVARGKELTAKDIVARGASDLANSLKADPAIRSRLSLILADIQKSLGDRSSARSLAQAALADAPDRAAAEAAHRLLSEIAANDGRFDDAMRHANAITEATVPDPTQSDSEFKALMLKLTIRRLQGEDPGDILAATRELLDAAELRYGVDAAETRSLRIRLAIALSAIGDTAGMETAFNALAMDIDLDQESDDPELAILALRQARLARSRKDYELARRFALWALAVRMRVYGSNHEKLTAVLSQLGAIETAAGNLDSAQNYFETAVVMGANVLASDSPVLAGLRYNTGVFLMNRRADASAALPLLNAAYAHAARSGASGINPVKYAVALAQAHAELGNAVEAKEKYTEAINLLSAMGDKTVTWRSSLRTELACLGVPDVPLPTSEEVRSAIAMMESINRPSATLGRLRRCLAATADER